MSSQWAVQCGQSSFFPTKWQSDGRTPYKWIVLGAPKDKKEAFMLGSYADGRDHSTTEVVDAKVERIRDITCVAGISRTDPLV